MKTIERNYRKHPHTARFLQVFHSAIGTDGTDHRPVATAPADDLLNLVPETTDLRSPRQIELMTGLIAQITELDAETGEAARVWTESATASGVYWTPGYEGTASAWITKMIAKVRELKAAAPAPTTAPAPQVADGRYAVEEDGTLKFFRVKNGRKAGVVFLDVQASDEWYSIRMASRKQNVLALIAADPKTAMIRYGKELGECGRCGRTLTDEASRAAGIGPICIDK